MKGTEYFVSLYTSVVITEEFIAVAKSEEWFGIARSEPDGTRWRTGGEVKGKHASGVGSQ